MLIKLLFHITKTESRRNEGPYIFIKEKPYIEESILFYMSEIQYITIYIYISRDKSRDQWMKEEKYRQQNMIILRILIIIKLIIREMMNERKKTNK